MTITGISGRQITDVYSGSNLLTYKTYIRYNGTSNPDKNLFLVDYPSFSFPSYNTSRIGYPYKAGQDIYKDGGSSNLIITCTFGALRPTSISTFNDVVRTTRQWLKTKEGTLELVDDGQSRFFEVVNITIDEITRETQAFGTIEVSFECTPYEYTKQPYYSETIKITNNQAYTLNLTNTCDQMRPIMVITFSVGEGVANNVKGITVSGTTDRQLFTITGYTGQIRFSEIKMMSPNENVARLYIDTESMICFGGTESNTTYTKNYTQYYQGSFSGLWVETGQTKRITFTPTLETSDSYMNVMFYPRERFSYE